MQNHHASKLIVLLAVLGVACATEVTQTPDGSAVIDAADSPDTASLPIDGSAPDARATADAAGIDADTSDAATAYRHTIVIDGTNDFAADDTFSTTSPPDYTAYISWDDTNLYVGYEGPDIDVSAAESAAKWLLVYIDTDPGQGTGANLAERYNTQEPAFPTGFGAEYYWRWKSDGTFSDLRIYSGIWTTVGNPAITHAVSGTFVEVAIPLAELGNPSSVGIVTLMLNETGNSEWTYAGLYSGSFTDDYNPGVGFYLDADFQTALTPNSPLRTVP